MLNAHDTSWLKSNAFFIIAFCHQCFRRRQRRCSEFFLAWIVGLCCTNTVCIEAAIPNDKWIYWVGLDRNWVCRGCCHKCNERAHTHKKRIILIELGEFEILQKVIPCKHSLAFPFSAMRCSVDEFTLLPITLAFADATNYRYFLLKSFFLLFSEFCKTSFDAV